ncbi:unnamed protein product [Ceutorhynchus assimilis]|uniref:Uncharacterized protein n=1 Tax=Ceutorhynchus assimilis TaxID=467358 RepID=A0A9N9QKT9_9CUCU|nr:unnamed protein product [Ceutorhynchus assimilis]
MIVTPIDRSNNRGTLNSGPPDNGLLILFQDDDLGLIVVSTNPYQRVISIKELENRLEKNARKQIPDLAPLDAIKVDIRNLESKVITKATARNSNVEPALYELQEREARAQNVLVFGLPEIQEFTDRKDRMERDKNGDQTEAQRKYMKESSQELEERTTPENKVCSWSAQNRHLEDSTIVKILRNKIAAESVVKVTYWYSNLRSFQNKIDEWRTNIQKTNPCFTCIKHTWLNAEISDGLIALPGYRTFRKDRKDKEDDIKLYCDALRQYSDIKDDLDVIQTWSERWQMKLNADKCVVQKIQEMTNVCPASLCLRGNDSDPLGKQYILNNCLLQHVNVNSQKDLGIIVSSDLKWEKHITSVVKKANSFTFLTRISFSNTSPQMILQLYKTYIRPNIEYTHSVCLLYKR